jgi:hypothetical protein
MNVHHHWQRLTAHDAHDVVPMMCMQLMHNDVQPTVQQDGLSSYLL